jgi:UDP-glucuronate 4-epimerase
MQVNLGGTMNVLEMCKRFGVRHFVLASTSSIYGQTTKVPFQEEDAADRPLASYPASKRSAELFAHVYHNLYGLDVTILRFFNVYGEDVVARI